MITKYKYTSDHDRSFEKDFNFVNKTIIQFGAAFKGKTVNSEIFNIKNDKYATVDLFPIENSKLHFQGNINSLHLWQNILKYVTENDKFDYCLISHTLEDLSNPVFVCRMMKLIAKQGFIIVPSKYIESTRINKIWRGHPHHKWIFNFENDNFIAYPKLNFIEYLDYINDLENLSSKDNQELQIFWENDIDLKVINDDFLGPSYHDVLEFYKNLLLN